MLSVRSRLGMLAAIVVIGVSLAGSLPSASALPDVPALPPQVPDMPEAAALSSMGGPLANAADLGEANHLEKFMDWHIWNRQVYEIDYASNKRDPNEVVNGQNAGKRYPGIAHITDTTDSGLWTGTYVAALAFKFQVAGFYLQRPGLTFKERAFWAYQRYSAVARVKPLLEQYHLKVNISKSWTAPPPDPSKTNPTPDSSGNINTGVAPFQGGEPGLLFRSCIPASAEDRLTFFKNADGSWQKDTIYGPLRWEGDGKDYYCEDGTSRDTYAGTTFGLITAFDLFGEALGNAELGGSLHQQIGNDLMLLTDFLVRHGWSTPRPHTKISTKNDLSSFYSPLMVINPGAQVHMSEIAHHVADEMGTVDQKLFFDALWQEEANGNDPFEAFGTELDAADKLSQYYKWNLGHLLAFDIVRLASPLERGRLKDTISVMDASTRSDQNAHFEAIMFSMTGEQGRLDASVQHLHQWKDWRANFETVTTAPYQVQYNSQRCKPLGDLDCVAQGFKTLAFMDITGAEHTQTFVDPPQPDPTKAPNLVDLGNDCNGTYYPRNCRSLYPIDIAKRTPTDFLWQRSPFSLDGDRRANHESQGIDYLLPYWMLRYYTEVNRPAVEPFTPYYGPYWK